VKHWWQPAVWAGIGKSRRWAVFSLVVLLGIGSVLLWRLWPESHVIAVQGLGEEISFTTKEQQLGAALQAQGIQLGPKDRVTPPLTTSLKGQKTVTVQVRKAVPVSITVDGQTVETQTAASSVGELLRELQISLGQKDAVSPDVATPVSANLAVKVVRRTEQVKVVREEIPFQTIRRADPTMNLGETKELQAGVPGVKEIKVVTYFEDGKEVGQEVVEETIVANPVDQVVAYGTVAVVSRGGHDYRYVRKLDMVATGYTAGKESNPQGNGHTYTGMKAVRGVVAVDPNVIPLYTRLYVEGYGPAIAADIGGAVKGYTIDLCFDTVEEALAWGRRPVTVYVLEGE
jgi:3D (Asp-Asp-Asp) domain-containing protein